jgi:hypothetical protein
MAMAIVAGCVSFGGVRSEARTMGDNMQVVRIAEIEVHPEWLEAYLAAGARFYLSGHMHRMCARNYGTLAILTAETTRVNFDKSPYAFRLLEIASDFSYTWRGIPVM